MTFSLTFGDHLDPDAMVDTLFDLDDLPESVRMTRSQYEALRDWSPNGSGPGLGAIKTLLGVPIEVYGE